jgi:hypothetical protein
MALGDQARGADRSDPNGRITARVTPAPGPAAAAPARADREQHDDDDRHQHRDL